MSQANPFSPVTAAELLARFVTVDKWVKADQTIRQDAFIPPKDLKLSVTRHINLTEDELWSIGQRVVDAITKKPNAQLYGRADIGVHKVSEQSLATEAAPLLENPNHAHIIGWPADKPAQKNIAQQLAAAAGKCVPKP